jgi:hypothetical protein
MMASKSESKRQSNGLSRGDLKWLNKVITMMLEEPSVSERKLFAALEKQLSKAIPKLLETFREEFANEVLARRLMNFVPQLAALYRRRASKAEIREFFDKMINGRLCRSFGPRAPNPEVWDDAVSELVDPADLRPGVKGALPPTDLAIQAVAGVLRAVGVHGVSRSDFMRLRKTMNKETKFPTHEIVSLYFGMAGR